ncbi:ribosome recycling factor [Spiroplasma tabanidicola]|uniref:Ribosome-recycling factor n=1 Tax=Spiroplasma tabanidicola TaxID=324079 RepID=A0A6I6C8D3_9MOLU|nr:ribosome recycling factor [Spiroplasma tabanidicola]QGS51699.1 ribosome recycling factor [Spiroplasma tabanidicola]
MLKDILENAQLEMEEVIEAFKHYLSKVRTGRANASMLKSVVVDFYGTPTPIDQTSQITSPEPQQLLVKPYDRGQLPNVVAAIHKADLGLNPMSEGDLIRIIIPQLTEDVRKDLVKKVHKELETFKIRVRNARRDANEKIKKSDFTEDDKGYGEDEVQKLTDKYIQSLDSITKDKEKDLMTI